MAIVNTITALDGVLKNMFRGKYAEKLTLQPRPFLGLVPKIENWKGRYYELPNVYGTPAGGRSASFAKALANKSALKNDAFTLTRVKNYATFDIEGEAFDATDSMDASAINGAVAIVEGATEEITDDLHNDLFGSGTGSRGYLTADPSGGTTATVATEEQASSFRIGMVLTAHATDGAVARSGTVTIAGVNIANKTLTASGDWDTGISAIASGDYLCVEGDLNAKIDGLASWIPFTAPTAGDSHFGVDRSVAPDLLAGYRLDAATMGINHTEAVIRLLKGTCRNRSSARPDVVMMSIEDWTALELEQIAAGSIQRGEVKARGAKGPIAEIGYQSIVINGPKGPVNCVADGACPTQYGWAVTLTSTGFYSIGKAPRPILRKAKDGFWLDDDSADGLTGRMGYYGQLGVHRPCDCGIVKFRALS